MDGFEALRDMQGMGALTERERSQHLDMIASQAPMQAHRIDPRSGILDALLPQQQAQIPGSVPGGVGPSPEWTMLNDNLGAGTNNYLQGQVQSMGIDPRAQFSLEDVIAAYMTDVQ